MTSWSSEPDASSRPSGDQRAQLTEPSCPESVASSRGTDASCSAASSMHGLSDQSLMRWSLPAVAKRVPSGCTSTEKIGCDSWETHVGFDKCTCERRRRRTAQEVNSTCNAQRVLRFGRVMKGVGKEGRELAKRAHHWSDRHVARSLIRLATWRWLPLHAAGAGCLFIASQILHAVAGKSSP